MLNMRLALNLPPPTAFLWSPAFQYEPNNYEHSATARNSRLKALTWS